jgi:hypothetical protein
MLGLMTGGDKNKSVIRKGLHVSSLGEGIPCTQGQKSTYNVFQESLVWSSPKVSCIQG